jgi:hypothetical protein
LRWLPVIEKVGDLAPPFDLTLIDAGRIGEAIYDILSSDAGVGALIGDRIHPLVIPQGVSLPAVTYQQITGLRVQNLASPQGMVRTRFQLNCWAETYNEADAVADEIRKTLGGYSGTSAKVYIYTISLDSEGDLIVVSPEIKREGKRLDFVIWFKELID